VDNEMRARAIPGRLLGMDPARALERLGGVARTSQLRKLTTKARLRRAERRGEVVRLARGRYALPTAQEALRAAARLTALLARRSAAAYWGWELKTQPPCPELIVPRNRNVPPERRRGLEITWADLRPDEVDGLATSRERTLVDCMRFLPFDEALAVADSALRHGDATSALLKWLAGQVAGKGAGQARRVAAIASGAAANPFESALRAIAENVKGLHVVPQVWLQLDGEWMRPDLLDSRRRLVIEAESFEWHGKRKSLERDCVRYNAFALAGYTVLRFSWEQVMFRPEYVEACLRGFLAGPGPAGRANGAESARKSA
jgi:very-short-patch-repair endonuclease